MPTFEFTATLTATLTVTAADGEAARALIDRVSATKFDDTLTHDDVEISDIAIEPFTADLDSVDGVELHDCSGDGCSVCPRTSDADLREALNEWFDDNPEHARPNAVSFRITHDFDDGPAWSTYGPTFHYDHDPEREERRDIPVDQLPDVDFDRTAVADALVKIGDFEQPQQGDTLRIALRPSA